MRKVSFFLMSLTVVCALSSCNGKKAENTLPPTYRTMLLDTTTAVVYNEYSAVIQSESVVEIRPKVSGYLTEIAVEEGTMVRQGDLLFKIDDADFKQNLNAAKAQMDNAELEVKKVTPLVEKGIISPLELTTKRSNFDAAKAAYENAKINLGYTSITSPITGLLGRIYVREGSLVGVTSQEPLTTISSVGDVYAYFSYDEKNIAPRRKEKMATGSYDPEKQNIVELIRSDGEIYKHKGRLASASGMIDRTTGSIQLKVIFPNPDLEILSGSSGVLRFPVTFNGCISIPQSATFEIQDKIMVYVVDENNHVHGKSITIEGVSEQNYIVLEGLQRGERIVLEGVSKLKEDALITPQD